MCLRVEYQDEIWEMIYGSVLGTVLSVLSGVLLWLSFPPAGWWVLAWVALVPAVLAQYVYFPRGLAFLAPLITFRIFIAGYFRELIRTSEGAHRGPLFLAMATVLLLTAPQRSFHERTGYRWFLVEPVCFWVALEWARDQLHSVGTWASLAYSQYTVRPVVHAASVVGTFGVSAMTVLANYGIVQAITGLRGGAKVKDVLRGTLCVAALVAIVLVAGWYNVEIRKDERGMGPGGSGPPDSERVSFPVRVALCQPGTRYSASEDWGLPAFEEMAGEAARHGATLFVLPEGCFSEDPREEPLGSVLVSLAKKHHVAIVAPYILDTPAGSINEAVFITAEGEIAGSSPKNHPLSLYGETSLTRGECRVYPISWGNVGVMICFDLDFTDVARELARAGANLIAVPSSDWRAVASRHYTHSVFRAAENGVAVVKADSWYASCAVSWDGSIEARTVSEARKRELLVVDVVVRSGPPFCGSTVGHFVGLLCATGIVLCRLYDAAFFLLRCRASRKALPRART